MLKYNFDRVFKARGIEKRYTYLKRGGFGEHLASRINRNEVAQLRLKEIEKLCLLLRCTPNDLFEWEPDDSHEYDSDHPMHKIRKRDKITDLTRTLNSIPLDKLDEIEELIHNQINETQSGEE